MAKNIQKTLLVVFLMVSTVGLAQKKYYRIENKIYDEGQFNYQKKGMVDSGNVLVEITDSITRNDSVIHNVKLTMLDPFERHRKKIGTHFSLANFKNEKGGQIASTFFPHTPTVPQWYFHSSFPSSWQSLHLGPEIIILAYSLLLNKRPSGIPTRYEKKNPDKPI